MPRAPHDGRPGVPGRGSRRGLTEHAGLLAVVGPTGTGKTALALRLAEALDGELIGCDALQVYRGFDAATAKPTPDERKRVAYHLVDCQDPREDFTLAHFVDRAERLIEEILARRRQPILVGGTGLYLRGLLRGIVTAPRVDPELRRRLQCVQERRSERDLHRWLSRVDPPSAERIPPTDRQRIGRALEWWLTSGTRWSERLERLGTWAGKAERYRCLKIGLDGPGEWLKPRLEARVKAFFAAGLVDEVRGLLDAGVPAQANAFKAIGYREVVAALAEGRPPEQVVESVQVATRRYVKRQRTWFRREPELAWLDARLAGDELQSQALATWARFSDGLR